MKKLLTVVLISFVFLLNGYSQIISDLELIIEPQYVNATNFKSGKVAVNPPETNVRFLGEGFVAVKGEDGKCSVYKFERPGLL